MFTPGFACSHWNQHVHTGISMFTLGFAVPTGISTFTLGSACSHWDLHIPTGKDLADPIRRQQNFGRPCSSEGLYSLQLQHHKHQLVKSMMLKKSCMCARQALHLSACICRATPARAPCSGSRWAQSGGWTATTRAELAHKELRRLHATRVRMDMFCTCMFSLGFTACVHAVPLESGIFPSG